MSENPTDIYDSYIYRQELEKGIYLANILKGKLNRKQKTKTSWLVTTIKQILKTSIHKLDNLIFSFKRTKHATPRNRKILSAFNGNLGAAIEAQKVSPLNYGSEFSDIDKLSKLLKYHEEKSKIINITQQGSSYHLFPINEDTRAYDLEEMLQIGIHKKSHSDMNSAALEKAINKEFNQGWALLLTTASLQRVNNSRVLPLGVVEKLSINKMGECYIKQLINHNCSFTGTSGLSLNNRVQR